MNDSALEYAFLGLVHDIGEFYRFSDASKVDDEKSNEKHDSVFREQTKEFLKEYLKSDELCAKLDDKELNDIIRISKCIAAGIDFNDDNAFMNNPKKTVSTRLSSIYEQVQFGKEAKKGVFELSPFSKSAYPIADYQEKSDEEASKDYQRLWQAFIDDLKKEGNFTGEINKYWFDRFCGLLYEYTTLIPALNVEDEASYVSLFDHLKLTSAIASCIALSDSKDLENPKFNMFEFDVSGIQKFIFKVTEGKDTKGGIAKSLRGRSFFISAITNIVTYSYLYEFGLTESNIIFNTGGGGLLLLPDCADYDERIEKVSERVMTALFEVFAADISYVYASVDCDAKELETFKTEKALELKEKLENEKSRKLHTLIGEKDFFYKKIKEPYVCAMCGTIPVNNEGGRCSICKEIEKLSSFFVTHDKMYLVYDFENKLNNKLQHAVDINELKYLHVYLISEEDYLTVINTGFDYIESLNHSRLGNTRWIANLVPQNNHGLLSMEQIAEYCIPEEYGDPKLAILKMDVDNLGAIFAFGLETRSLSKFLTLSRLTEVFFGHHLVKICKDVSKEINPDIAKQSHNESMFYINYAGGDDLAIIGPAAGIIKLSLAINDKLNEYTLNDNISISGGINIQSPTYPVRFGIQEAEEYLEQAKENDGKNSVTLIHTTCKMKEFEEVLDKVDEYKSYIDNEKISRTTFYQIMNVLDTDSENLYLRSIPRILYSLTRNVSDVEIRNQLKNEIAASNITMNQLKVLVLEMKLAIMQTRRG